MGPGKHQRHRRNSAKHRSNSFGQGGITPTCIADTNNNVPLSIDASLALAVQAASVLAYGFIWPITAVITEPTTGPVIPMPASV